MSLSNTMLRVMLPSTNEVVYEVQPQYLNEQEGTTLAERARMFGYWRAVRIGTDWFEKAPGGGLRKIADPRTCHLLQTLPEA